MHFFALVSVVWTCATLVAGSTGAIAQPQAAAPGVALPDQVELPRLVDLCAQRLKVAIDYDSKILAGAVTLRLGSTVSDQELWALTNRLLASRGFTIVRQAGEASGLTVVNLEQAAGLARIEDLSVEAPATPTPLAGFRSVLVHVEHRAVKELIDGLKVVLSKRGGAAAEVPGLGGASAAASPGPTGTGTATAASGPAPLGGYLLISDLTPRVDYALSLLRRLDAPIDSGFVTEISLKYLTPAQAISFATLLATKREGIAGRKPVGELMPAPNGDAVLLISPESRITYWRELIRQVDQREGLETVNYTSRYFALKDVAKLIEEHDRRTIWSGPDGTR